MFKYIFFIASCLLISISGFTQNKVCFVSVNELFYQMPETKTAGDELSRFNARLQADYKKMEDELNADSDQFSKEQEKMAPAVKEARRKDLSDRINQLSTKKNEMENSYTAKQKEMEAVIYEKLNGAIKKVAAANGYNHILIRESAIIYPPEDEISDKVRNELGIK